jgi:hypothetical protein
LFSTCEMTTEVLSAAAVSTAARMRGFMGVSFGR